MTTYQADEVKEAVREKYAEVAQQGTSCCAPATNVEDACCGPAEVRFTSKNEAEAIIGEADLGLSCGSPTAFGTSIPATRCSTSAAVPVWMSSERLPLLDRRGMSSGSTSPRT